MSFHRAIMAANGGAKNAIGQAKSALLAGLAGVTCAGLNASAAWADQPVAKGITLQPAASPVMQDIRFFHDKVLLPIIVIIVLLVFFLLAYVVVRFNKKANPVPAKFTHNVLIEVIWTVFPIMILIGIAVFSFPLLYKEDVVPSKYDLTIKAVGHQWYWTYEYADYDNYEMTANLLPDDEAKAAGKPRLLATDNPLVVPVGQVVRIQTNATDVIHSWALPAFGVKLDAEPGRLNETWFQAEKVGVYYGQCSEICGPRHAFMPIEIHVVSQEDFNKWIAEQSGLAAPTSGPHAPPPVPAPAAAPAPVAAAPAAGTTPAGGSATATPAAAAAPAPAAAINAATASTNVTN